MKWQQTLELAPATRTSPPGNKHAPGQNGPAQPQQTAVYQASMTVFASQACKGALDQVP
jgi:hypothetical protein